MQNYKATVYAVESKVDMATRTLKVRATYPNPGENILPGRYTSVEISKREIKDALAIPSEALSPRWEKTSFTYIRTAWPSLKRSRSVYEPRAVYRYCKG